MKYVYQLVAPVYGWDGATYTVGLFSSLESAVSKAKSQMDDVTYLFVV